MITSPPKKYDSFLKDASSLIHVISQMAEDLKKARTQKGTKSAHFKMSVKKQYISLKEKVDIFTLLLREILPNHWEMDAWGFMPNASGTFLKWSSKNGTSNKGLNISLEDRKLLMFTGYLLSLIHNNTHKFSVDTPSLKKMGLSNISTPEPFMFLLKDKTYNVHAPDHIILENGFSPVDAFSKIVASGKYEKNFNGMPMTNTDDDIINEGWIYALNILKNKGRKWSASYILWTKIFENEWGKKLLKGTSYTESSKSSLTLNLTFFKEQKDWSTILKALKTVNTTEPMSFFYVGKSEKSGHIVKAWDAHTALIAHLMSCGCQHHSVPDKYDVKVFPVGKELDTPLLL
jgi:hypothetical protein